MIKHTVFRHGWFYHYRLHKKKSDILCCLQFSPLKNYLEDVFDNCPNNYFTSGPRSSEIRLEVDAQLKQVDSHKVCLLAKEALMWKEYKTAHSNVQVFMLNFDKNTIGAEVPIWLLPEELDGYGEIFNDKSPLTGHIDVLQINDGKIWVWDYKPEARLEKFAKTQVYLYAYMLSRRTKIPLEHFMCGYFDEKQAFIFAPAEAKIPVPVASLASGY